MIKLDGPPAYVVLLSHARTSAGVSTLGFRGMSPSVRMIIELNIKHYRELLKSETDVAKRRTIAQLLAEEEAKLAKLINPPKESEG